MDSIKEYSKSARRTGEIPHSPAIFQTEKQMELIHCAFGLTTETGEFVDQLKKSIFYKKELDEVNLQEELGDILWYMGNLCEALGWDLSEIMQRNINKLKKRYPEKFCTEKAVNRDLQAERQELET